MLRDEDKALKEGYMSESWKPTIGEECLHNGSKCTPLIVEPDSDNMVVVERNGEYIIAINHYFEPIPKHTDNELLAYELYCLLFGKLDTFEFLIKHNDQVIKSCLKIVESGRFK